MNNLYEADFFQWTQETSDRLRRREFTQIDIPALVEEVEDLGKRQKSALQSRLAVLIGHLLKWDRQPASVPAVGKPPSNFSGTASNGC